MSKRRPKDLESRLDLFSEGLIKHSESDLQEFLRDAPQWFADEPSLEFLRLCKARVDARLTAEPDKKVFSMNDPHEIRVRLWYEISDSLEAEINFRSGKSTETVGDSARSTRNGDPEVAKRRFIVKENRTKSAQKLCKIFDFHSVHLPSNWQDEFSAESWSGAYLNPKLRHSIQSLISRDKQATAKP